MDVALVVNEVDFRRGIFNGKLDTLFEATAKVSVEGKTLVGMGEHEDQLAAEHLAIADLKAEYRNAFPPTKIVVTKTISVDFD